MGAGLVAGLLACGVALATPEQGPWSDEPLDPAQVLLDRIARAQGADLLYGARAPGPLTMAWRLERVQGVPTILDDALAPERSVVSGAPPIVWAWRPMVRLASGTERAQLQAGDTEPGLVSLRGRMDAAAYVGPGEFRLGPEVRVDEGGDGGGVRLALPDAWAGIHTDHVRAGFGLEQRWFGPGRHGGLMLTDNARPAPLGSVAGEGRVFERFGRIRAEVGAGWLDAPRTDVQRPGWLVADLRYAPVPQVELGATRVGIFAGEGRPAPDLGQLLLPTRPHVYDDPDQRQPDQDEIAALDLRVTLPVGQWANGPRANPGTGLALDTIELWTQYGGEDVITRSIGPIPVPALAGIANLWGAEIGLGALTLVTEYARVMDDAFRWYTGHRVYHSGFTQDGQVMGHPSGGDSRSIWGAARWFPGTWGIELSAEDVLRVGAVDADAGRILALMNPERTTRGGIRGWWSVQSGRWLHAGASVERTRGSDFVPGPDIWGWRVFVGH